jgi:hypothetical protein
MSRLRLDLYQSGVPWGNWQEVVFLPFRATLLGVEMTPGYSASIGPLLLGLGVAAWLGWSTMSAAARNIVRDAAVIVVPGFLVWIIAGRFSHYLLQTRLYFVLFPALTVLAAVGFSNFDRSLLPGIRLGWLVGVFTLLVLGLNAFQVGVTAIKQGALDYVMGLNQENEYLTRNLGWYLPAVQALEDLPDGSRVIMLWEARSLHCLERCTPDEILDRWLRERYEMDPNNPRKTSGILESWRRSGFTHLLLHRAGAEFVRLDSQSYQPEDWIELDQLLTNLEMVDDFGGAYQLYSLMP